MGGPSRRTSQFFQEACDNCLTWISCLAWLNAHSARLEAEFPPITSYQRQIIDNAQAIGLIHGSGPMPWTEIAAWLERSEINYTLGEQELLRDISATYISVYRASEKEEVDPPYMTEEGALKRAIMKAKARKSALMAAANNKK